jgi:hypothetical protein
MQDARYLRSQAEMCLKMAAQASVQSEADHLRLMAAEFLARADELENQSGVLQAGGVNQRP